MVIPLCPPNSPLPMESANASQFVVTNQVRSNHLVFPPPVPHRKPTQFMNVSGLARTAAPAIVARAVSAGTGDSDFNPSLAIRSIVKTRDYAA